MIKFDFRFHEGVAYPEYMLQRLRMRQWINERNKNNSFCGLVISKSSIGGLEVEFQEQDDALLFKLSFADTPMTQETL